MDEGMLDERTMPAADDFPDLAVVALGGEKMTDALVAAWAGVPPIRLHLPPPAAPPPAGHGFAWCGLGAVVASVPGLGACLRQPRRQRLREPRRQRLVAEPAAEPPA